MRKIHLLSTCALASAFLTPVVQAQLGLSLVNGAKPETYVEIPYNATLVPKTGITVEAWITYDESTLGTGWRYPTVMRMHQDAGKESYYLRIDAHNSQSRTLTFKAATTTGTINASWSFAAGALKKWTHVAGTYDGQNVNLFVNGKLQTTAVAFSRGTLVNNTTGTRTLRIGNGSSVAPGIEVWHGQIDEVRLWPFARTAAEIASTMGLALNKVPGEVSTWNLDFKGSDSSGKNVGKDVGATSSKKIYAVNTLKLSSSAANAVAYGGGSAACQGKPEPGVSALPKIGSKDFGLVCLRAPASANGVVWGGVGKLGTAVKLLGVDVWVNTAALGFLFSIKSDAQGVGRLPVPIPNLPVLANLPVHAQFVWEDQSCKTAFSASSGLTVTLQK